MFDRRTSVYVRLPFLLAETADIAEVILRMKYDDGFVADPNGERVASRNAADFPPWEDAATSTRDDSAVVIFEEHDLRAFAGLLREGKSVLAIQGLNASGASSDMLVAAEMEIGRILDAEPGSAGYLTRPTPGLVNGPGFGGFVADTKFGIDRGFHAEPLEAAITTATEGATIRYTVGGAAPAADSGVVCEGPLRIDRTTVLRAASFKADLVPSNTDTQPRPNNFYALFNRREPDGFKYFEHGSEHSPGTGEDNTVIPFTTGSGETQFNPHRLHERLVEKRLYRAEFADRVQRHFCNGGLLSAERAVGCIDRRADQIREAIIAESARGGDSKRDQPFAPSDGERAVDEVRRWMDGRVETVVGQFRSQG